MSNKVTIKLVVEVEYELNEDSAYNLTTAFEDRVHRIMPQIIEHPNAPGEGQKPKLLGWDFHTTAEEL